MMFDDDCVSDKIKGYKEQQQIMGHYFFGIHSPEKIKSFHEALAMIDSNLSKKGCLKPSLAPRQLQEKP